MNSTWSSDTESSLIVLDFSNFLTFCFWNDCLEFKFSKSLWLSQKLSDSMKSFWKDRPPCLKRLAWVCVWEREWVWEIEIEWVCMKEGEIKRERGSFVSTKLLEAENCIFTFLTFGKMIEDQNFAGKEKKTKLLNLFPFFFFSISIILEPKKVFNRHWQKKISWQWVWSWFEVDCFVRDSNRSLTDRN